MTDLDPDLAARLRELFEARVRAQVQAAKQRADYQRDTRAAFAANRDAGLRSRHAARKARLDLIQHHDQKGAQP